MADGRNLPVECRYIGWDHDDQVHVWETVQTLDATPARITVDVLPARTSIQVRCGAAG